MIEFINAQCKEDGLKVNESKLKSQQFHILTIFENSNLVSVTFFKEIAKVDMRGVVVNLMR